MKEKLRLYIKNNLTINTDRPRQAKTITNTFSNIETYSHSNDSIEKISDFINTNKEDNKFQKLLFQLIDKRNLKDSDVYNKVNIDRRLFSKIRSDINYHPNKCTVIKLGLALNLSEEEMEQLLNSASYSLPKNNTFDLIIRFCLIEKVYDINKVNELLYEYKCNLL